jgi:hypothetical protein
MQKFESPGRAVAAALRGAWRSLPPKLEIPPERIAAVSHLLLESGAGALAWWRIRHSDFRLQASTAQQLRETYLHYAMAGVKHEHQVAQAFAALRSAGVEPILIKGWSIGRLYPESGLRPTGDIDLWVSPRQYAIAQAVMNTPACQGRWVDLEHDEFTRFDDRNFEELYNRSEIVRLEDTEVRVLGAEDHLRLLCVHLLKHGAWRPLWLCDVAVALESRPSSFDWDRCLGRNKRWANWVLCTLGLANRLLGADLGDVPLRNHATSLPRWLVPSVLRQWNTPYSRALPLMADQLKQCLRQPSALLRGLKQRWPNPIQATVDADAPFNGTNRLPLQIRDCFLRAVKVLPQLAGSPRK